MVGQVPRGVRSPSAARAEGRNDKSLISAGFLGSFGRWWLVTARAWVRLGGLGQSWWSAARVRPVPWKGIRSCILRVVQRRSAGSFGGFGLRLGLVRAGRKSLVPLRQWAGARVRFRGRELGSSVRAEEFVRAFSPERDLGLRFEHGCVEPGLGKAGRTVGMADGGSPRIKNPAIFHRRGAVSSVRIFG